MANPITLYLCNLIPPMSYPATCLDHNVVFRATGGMADIEACPGEKFDRVILLLINEQMIRLDEIELFYHRIKVNCIDYQNQSHVVYAYQMNNNINQPISLLHERYLDIIIKVYEYYKVRPEYISVTYRFISLELCFLISNYSIITSPLKFDCFCFYSITSV
jgi:hypothetical protein